MDWETYPDDLEKFANSLRLNEATVDTADRIIGDLGRLRSQWKKRRTMEVSQGLPLPRPRKKALHPRGCDIESTELTFMFCVDDETELPKQADFQVCVRGSLLLDSAAVVDLEDHWRVDTHTYGGRREHRVHLEEDPTHQETEDKLNEPHPLFHFQRGGNAQDDFADHPSFVPGGCLPDRRIGSPYRGLMQLPGPRIPVLPMCPILAVDFTISQCDGIVWRALRNKPEYSNLVGSAQERLWIPVFERLSEPKFRQAWLGGAWLAQPLTADDLARF